MAARICTVTYFNSAFGRADGVYFTLRFDSLVRQLRAAWSVVSFLPGPRINVDGWRHRGCAARDALLVLANFHALRVTLS